jgi:hypothetical protein
LYLILKVKSRKGGNLFPPREKGFPLGKKLFLLRKKAPLRREKLFLRRKKRFLLRKKVPLLRKKVPLRRKKVPLRREKVPLRRKKNSGRRNDPGQRHVAFNRYNFLEPAGIFKKGEPQRGRRKQHVILSFRALARSNRRFAAVKNSSMFWQIPAFEA